MTVAAELQAAARAIRRSSPPTATFALATAALLDQIALSAPLVEMHLPPITTKALVVARAYLNPSDPSGTVGLLDETAVASRRAAVAVGVAVPGGAATPAQPKAVAR